MKRIVQLAVLCATLLLLTGIASAQFYECYEMTCTPVEVDNGCGDVITHYVEISFAPWDGLGAFDGICGEEGEMSLFWDTRIRAISTSTENEWGDTFLEFHGGINGVTGIVNCFGCQYTIRAHIVDYENCVDD